MDTQNKSTESTTIDLNKCHTGECVLFRNGRIGVYARQIVKHPRYCELNIHEIKIENDVSSWYLPNGHSLGSGTDDPDDVVGIVRNIPADSALDLLLVPRPPSADVVTRDMQPFHQWLENAAMTFEVKAVSLRKLSADLKTEDDLWMLGEAIKTCSDLSNLKVELLATWAIRRLLERNT